MRGRASLLLSLLSLPGSALPAEQAIPLPGLRQKVEILRDRWGIPHIYANNDHDLFFAQGYITARDRLFQLDLWRRAGTGRLSEVLGPSALPRDRIARLVRYRGDWNQEWQSYSPDAHAIVAAFVAGINAHIGSLAGKRPPQFEAAGYDPGRWQPEDVVSRIAGLVMVRNVANEVARTARVRAHGLEREAELFPPDPFIPLALPKGLDLTGITSAILADYQSVSRAASGDSASEGSNNWVVAGSKTATGKPLLANDPHRPITLPSLRKTVHLVAPGWDVIGAGEPALPGIALGHNQHIAFGFTIVGIDQADIYVEKLNPANSAEYWSRGAWRRMEIEQTSIPVKDAPPVSVELRYTAHGPVLYVDPKRNQAYALKWVGAEPGGAGYLPALRLARAGNWQQFREATSYYRVPSENLVYADRRGNIGWIAAGAAPIRKNWSGLFPVPGDSGEYEWQGYLPLAGHPQLFNPPAQIIATANHNILTAGYTPHLSYEWAPPYRFRRVWELLHSKNQFTVSDFKSFQQDVLSLPAKRFQAFLQRELPRLGGRARATAASLLEWDASLHADSRAALLFEVWLDTIYPMLFTSPQRPSLDVLLTTLEKLPNPTGVLIPALEQAWLRIELRLGKQQAAWTWGAWHQVKFPGLTALPRPGDANTVNAASGPNLSQSAGASYRQILDLANWDNSVTTNVPGESGDPSSPHYSDLLNEWDSGNYHPLLYTRPAIEAAAVERIRLVPSTPQPGQSPRH